MPAAALPAFTFSVALLPAVMDVGVTEALAPLGVPDTARLIVPPLPTTVVEMVLEPLAPCTELHDLGQPEQCKCGTGCKWLIVPPLPTTVVEMVLEPLAPCTTLTLLGLAEIVKFGLGAVTVSCTVVVWVTDPSVPVTVSV